MSDEESSHDMLDVGCGIGCLMICGGMVIGCVIIGGRIAWAIIDWAWHVTL